MLTRRSRQLKLTAVSTLTDLAPAIDGPDPGKGLAAAAALRRLVEEVEALHVRNARAAGWSWEAIANALGITRQSVHRKHAHRGVQ
jgi:hypothetical protein